MSSYEENLTSQICCLSSRVGQRTHIPRNIIRYAVEDWLPLVTLDETTRGQGFTFHSPVNIGLPDSIVEPIEEVEEHGANKLLSTVGPINQ